MKIEAFSPFRVSEKRGERGGERGVPGPVSRFGGPGSKGERGEGKLAFL
jgi:hypothetical protein